MSECLKVRALLKSTAAGLNISNHQIIMVVIIAFKFNRFLLLFYHQRDQKFN